MTQITENIVNFFVVVVMENANTPIHQYTNTINYYQLELLWKNLNDIWRDKFDKKYCNLNIK